MFVSPMAENLLPVDLDYTDMWLSSDKTFLAGIGGVKTSRCELHRQLSRLDVDFLAEHLSAFALSSSKSRLPKQTLGFERFKLPAYGSSDLMSFNRVSGLKSGCFNVGPRVCGSTPHPILDFTEPVCEFGLSKPSLTQVENYLLQLKRLRILQRQQSMLRNQVFPVQRSTISSKSESYSRGSSGTGVFHPQNVKYSIRNGSAATSAAGSMKKTGSRNCHGNKIMIKQRTCNPGQADISHQKEDCYYHLPPDMEFSKDWTY